MADFPWISQAYGINDHGHVVGRFVRNENFDNDAFLWKPESGVIILPPLQPQWSAGGNKINNQDEVLGYAQNGPNSTTTVIWRPNGEVIDLGSLPGQDQNFANDINNLGQVCGGTNGDLGDIAYIWTPAQGYIPIWNPYNGGSFISAHGINDQGDVTGALSVPGIGTRGFVRKANGSVQLLNDLLDSSSSGWNITWSLDINNKGQISARGIKNGQTRGVMLQPIKDRTPIGIGGIGR